MYCEELSTYSNFKIFSTSKISEMILLVVLWIWDTVTASQKLSVFLTDKWNYIPKCKWQFYNFKLRLPLRPWNEAALLEWVWGEAWAAKSDRTQLGENFIEQSFAHTLEKDYHLLFGRECWMRLLTTFGTFFGYSFYTNTAIRSLPFVAYCTTHRRCNVEKFG